MITVIIDSKYHRTRLDDWIAGGKVEFKGKTYCWSAEDSGYGFGWEIEPVSEEDWIEIEENEYRKIEDCIKQCLTRHQSEYSIKPSEFR